jgi:hypothetical protein
MTMSALSLKTRYKLPASRVSLCATFCFGIMFCTNPHGLPRREAPPLRRRMLDQAPILLPRQETLSTKGDDPFKLDFFVAGFPKCGTTTLLKTFEAHNETVVPPKEECSFSFVNQDDVAYMHLKDALNTTNPNVKRGIKCPFGLTTTAAIERLEDWFPSTKLIYGLRHPVYFFQSFYNFRVNTVRKGKMNGPIPPAESLIGSIEWAKVSTDTARFEQVLKKLGKTKDYKSTPFKVFLYTLEQMEDENEGRRAIFRETLGSFLELKHEIQPLQAANTNHHVGQKAFEETIDICDVKYNHLRSVLVQNGKKTQQWIREELLQSPDVTVANGWHFDEILEQWGLDPCVKVANAPAK